MLDPVAQKEKFRETIVNVTNEKITAEFRDDIQGVFRAFMQSCKNICSSHVNRAFHSAISDISQNKDIVCVNYDKGNGICVMNTDNYLTKLDSIVNDTDKFSKVKRKTHPSARYPTIRRQEVVKELIDKHIKKHVPENLCKKLSPVGCGPGKLYGTCKVHKIGNP